MTDLQSQIAQLEAQIKQTQFNIQDVIKSNKPATNIKDRSAQVKFNIRQREFVNKNTAEGTLLIENIRGVIEGLKAQILTEVEENPIIGEKKTNPLLIPALIIGAILLL